MRFSDLASQGHLVRFDLRFSFHDTRWACTMLSSTVSGGDYMADPGLVSLNALASTAPL